ncbi:Membrane protein insertase YidC [Stieleria bergensis]|uniref:Membrane protein insertase YidC n=1 Tax=Stieleria bergensis TaxID=2528025 RepID=A0A517SS52_9BACT|nr:Membrane protein insertase YidC [Planctomycetes bacterium SV_7m_r]
MDRRTQTFLLASAAFLFFYLYLRSQLVPQEDLANNEQKAAQVDQPNIGEQAPENQTPIENEVTSTDVPESWYTLGSFDPKAGGHNLLVTFTNRGGAIERVELVRRKDGDVAGPLEYRRIDTRSGYLGYLALRSAEDMDGVRVNLVAPGTPASLAKAKSGETGLLVGDIITAINGVTVADKASAADVLAKTKPDQEIAIEVLRPSKQATAAPTETKTEETAEDIDEETGEEVGEDIDEEAGGDDEASSEEKADTEDESDAAKKQQVAGTLLVFQATLTDHPLDLIRLADVAGDDQVVGNLTRASCLMTLASVGRNRIKVGERYIESLGAPEDLIWDAKVETGDGGVQKIIFETVLGSRKMEGVGKPLKLRRSYAITPGSYVIDMDVEVINLAESPQEVVYRLDGPNGVTAEGWWYSNKISPNWGGAAARDIVYNTVDDGHQLISGMSLLKAGRKDPKKTEKGIFARDSSEEARQLSYIAVDAQYFAASYLPAGDATLIDSFSRATATLVADPEEVPRHQERAVNVSFFVNGPEVQLAAAGQAEDSFKQSLRLYVGPKEPTELAQYGMDRFVYYGWFSFVSTPLSWLLHFLVWGVGNYGLGVVLLTVVVRSLMFPLSRNAAINAQRMQELAPQMKKIAEKYKDDMEGRMRAQQALQRKVGFNPLAGCLPMVLQLPIFMGLYRALSVDIDLRQKPLWDPNGWASNMAAPDQLYFWADWMPEWFSGRGTGWLGPYMNILPLFVVALFLTQQKMFMPPATDEQQAMTQKVMTFMTLFMGLFFFKVPAGLCVYFIASSTWGICERLLVKRTLPSGKHFDLDDDDGVIDVVATSKSSKQKSGGLLGLAEKLADKVNQKEPEPPKLPPGKRKRPPQKKKN